MYDIILGRSKSDQKKFGKKGTVLIGKQYVQMGQTSSLSNPIYLDVARAHAMLICGKRGGGKCLEENSEIILDSGEIVKIKDIKTKIKDKNIFSVNNKYKIGNYNATNFYSRKVKELLKIKLRSGKELKLTPEHQLLTINEWLEVKKLKIGSRIATPRKIPVNGQQEIGIEKIKILAYLIAEGHLGNNFILFSNSEKELVNDFYNSIKTFDKTLMVKNHSKDTLRVIQKNKRTILKNQRNKKGQFEKGIKFESQSSLRKYLESLKLYNTNSYSKFIPNCVFTSPNYEIKEFLKILFSCDGSIYLEKKKYWKISYSSSSKKLINQVSHLLLRFEIISKFREKKIKYKNNIKINYELEIKGKFVENYIEKIGFIGKKKKKSQIALKAIKTIKRNPNLDTIPKEIWQRYKPILDWNDIGQKLNYKIPSSASISLRYNPSREKLAKIAKIDNNLEILNLAESQIFWDEIINIEKLIGNFTVYDITCPDFNNFISNDIIVHNSYTMGSIAEGLADLDEEISQNLCFILLDTMGIYWSMKYANKKDDDLLKKWNLEGKGLDVEIYVPGGFYNKYKEEGIPVDFPFYIQPKELSIEDWMLAFKLETDNNVAVALQRVINRALNSGENFDIDYLINETEKDGQINKETKLAVINRFENCKTWGIFSKNGTQIKDLLQKGKVIVMDLSPYVAMPGGWEIKALTLGIISKKIFIERMLIRKKEELFDIVNKVQLVKKKEIEDDIPMPWLIIDEAHEFLPSTGITPASRALMTILKEGRQPGVSLILATQQPGKIHTDAITQSDLVLSHRITASFDLEALDKIFLSYDSKGSKNLFNTMPRVKGCAIIMDDKNERLHTIQIKPRITWHGGEDPNAIKEIKDEFDLD